MKFLIGFYCFSLKLARAKELAMRRPITRDDVVTMLFVLFVAFLVWIVLLFALAFFSFSPAHADDDIVPSDRNWTVPEEEAPRAVPNKTAMFCYSYIKGLKRLWFDIHRNGIPQTMIDHPPAAEGMPEDAALVLANEIWEVGPADAQSWIEDKWAACVADPYSVRRNTNHEEQ